MTDKDRDEKERKAQLDRLFDEDGHGLIITYPDGRKERIGGDEKKPPPKE